MANHQDDYMWTNGDDVHTYPDQTYPHTHQNNSDSLAQPRGQAVSQDFQPRNSTEAQPGSYFEAPGANVDANNTTDPTRDRFQDHYIRDNFLDQQGQAYADRMRWGEDPQRARASRKKSLGKQVRGPKGHSSKRQKHHGDGHGKKSSTRP